MHYPHPSHVHMPFLPPVCSVTERRTAVERGGEEEKSAEERAPFPSSIPERNTIPPRFPFLRPFLSPPPHNFQWERRPEPLLLLHCGGGQGSCRGEKKTFFVPPLPQIRESGKRRGAEKESGKSRGGDTSDVSLPLPDTHTGEMSSSFTTSTSVSPSSPAPPPSSQD